MSISIISKEFLMSSKRPLDAGEVGFVKRLEKCANMPTSPVTILTRASSSSLKSIGRNNSIISSSQENFHKNKDTVAAYSPSSVTDSERFSSFEAPARLQSARNAATPRSRSCSVSENNEPYCKLDTCLLHVLAADLPDLVDKADCGLKAGVDPILANDGLGGTYFLRDATHAIRLIFKPSDEEPFAPFNPHQRPEYQGKHRPAYKGGILPGFGMFRELVAFALDNGFSGVPPTHIAKVRHQNFPSKNATSSLSYKIGSVQSYVRNLCTAEDMGPSLFDTDDVQRIAILDIRLCNLDRHLGNLLISHNSPYQSPKDSLTNNYCHQKDSGLHISHSLKITSNFTTQSNNFSSSSPSLSHPYDTNTSALSHCVSLSLDESDDSRGNSTTSIATTTTVPKLRVVPIDHGYCLPHILHMKEISFAWSNWKQVMTPLSHSLLQYVEELDAEQDVLTLRKLVGEAVPETSLLTLRVCTRLLKSSVSAGLSLHDIAYFMNSPPVGDINDDSSDNTSVLSNDGTIDNHLFPSSHSPLQCAVMYAIQQVTLTDLTPKANISSMKGHNIANRLLTSTTTSTTTSPSTLKSFTNSNNNNNISSHFYEMKLNLCLSSSRNRQVLIEELYRAVDAMVLSFTRSTRMLAPRRIISDILF